MSKEVRNLYEMIPVHRRDSEVRDDGMVDVLIPRYGEGRIGRLLRSVFTNTPVRVHLDEIGTSVWKLCDGRHSVHDIGQTLQGQFGERIEPVYDLLEQFLVQMKRSELIDWKN